MLKSSRRARAAPPSRDDASPFGLPLATEAMEAHSAEALPTEAGR
jgi:hypothetical protein